jgi:hypothetical protein
MAMNKGLFHIILLSILIASCRKETVQDENYQSWLRFPDTDGAYVARDVIALSDGSVLLGCVSMIEGPFGTSDLGSSNNRSPKPALLMKFNKGGKLIWKSELPEEIQTLWHHIVLNKGEIFLVGQSSDPSKPEVGVARFNKRGELQALSTILNQQSFFGQISGGTQSVDCMELSSGEIVVALPSSQASNLPTMPRLVVMDSMLNISYDKFFRPDDVIKSRYCYQMRINSDPNGNIILNGWDTGFNNDTLDYFAYVVKLAADTYAPVYHQIFYAPSEVGVSPAAVNNEGGVIWTSTGPEALDTTYGSIFNFRNQEIFHIGNSIKLWVTNWGFQSNDYQADIRVPRVWLHQSAKKMS